MIKRLEPSKSELGAHRGTFFRVYRGTGLIRSYQVLHEAMESLGPEDDLYQVDIYTNGSDDRLISKGGQPAHIN